MKYINRVVASFILTVAVCGCGTIGGDNFLNGRLDLNDDISVDYVSKAAPLLDMYYPGAGQLLKSVMVDSGASAAGSGQRLPDGWNWRYVAYDASGNVVDLTAITLRPVFYESPKVSAGPVVTAETILAAQYPRPDPSGSDDVSNVPAATLDQANALLDAAREIASEQ